MGVALILTGLVTRKLSLSQWAGTLPALVMLKEKVELTAEPRWEAAEAAVGALLESPEIDRRDGLRLSKGLEWVHLRKSGTEPIIRVIAEAPARDRAQALIRAARTALT